MPIVKVEREDVLREKDLRKMLDKLKGHNSLQGTYTLRARYKEGKRKGQRIVQRFNINCRRAECLLSLLWIFGKRITEILLLKRGDLQIGDRFLTVKFRVLKKPKTSSLGKYVKRITLKHPYVKYITSYINEIEDSNEFLFPGKSGKRNFVSKVQNKRTGETKVYKYVRREHGFMSAQKAWKVIKFLDPNAYCHLFRHSLATIMAENEYTEDQLMSWFDWSSSGVAHGYVLKGPRLIKEASRRTW